jgi:hypothetical protein
LTIIQDFSVPASNDMDVTFILDPADGISLTDAQVLWSAYGASFAAPVPLPVLIVKDSNVIGPDGTEITIVESPETFVVHLFSDDTALAPGNYYHEAEVIDASGNHATVCQGSMTVTLALVS